MSRRNVLDEAVREERASLIGSKLQGMGMDPVFPDIGETEKEGYRDKDGAVRKSLVYRELQ